MQVLFALIVLLEAGKSEVMTAVVSENIVFQAEED
ncbi:predicted protein [Plenodomus lingam JN3]|uniref:Predicted protein n=1 Tax=Leptosphaeria maculans (strain JN3 / isolate v23.1.3 / race Av1-4-5-6-7-8) TaxID=985895 RepID=E5R4U9_LEPMJ|nr:predicted protein [Plenodomus lingam JN3]CBX92222.1 predicted protein [Plenodomus lingam JN3]